ncbi:MAG: DUF465 domain-containing protein [Arenicella sp.]
MQQRTDEKQLEELAELTQLHRDLDIAIHTLMENPYNDQLQLTRLKKRKLRLKEHIEKLRSSLIPDMPA